MEYTDIGKTFTDFKPGDRVIYIPNHACGDRTHKDCEWGVVSSISSMAVFVKFNKQVAIVGWDCTAQGCYPNNLEME